MEAKITYFEDVRTDNTEATFALTRERLKGSAIKKLVLASTTGAAAERAARFFRDDGVKLIVVPHQFDFKRATNPFPQDLARSLREMGHEVHFATMLFHTDELLRFHERHLDGEPPAMFQSGRKGMLRDSPYGNGRGPHRKRGTGDSHSWHGTRLRHGPGHAGSLVTAPEKAPGERDSLQAP